MSTFVKRVEGLMQPVEILRRLKEGAIVVCGPDGMSESAVKAALVDATLGLKKEPDRPRVYLVLDAAASEEAPVGAGLTHGYDGPDGCPLCGLWAGDHPESVPA